VALWALSWRTTRLLYGITTYHNHVKPQVFDGAHQDENHFRIDSCSDRSNMANLTMPRSAREDMQWTWDTEAEAMAFLDCEKDVP
jgi:hypothetical protein